MGKGIRFKELSVGYRETVESEVLPGQLDGRPRRLDGDNLLGPSSQRVSSESPGVGEAVENGFVAGERVEEESVLALIQKEPSFLPLADIDQKFKPVLLDLS